MLEDPIGLDRPGARGIGCRLAYAGVGVTPIVALALSLVEVVPLHVSAPILLGLAVTVGCGIAWFLPDFRRPVVRGLGAGLIAVLIYDCTRLPFAILGGWPDFIPRIGAWLLDEPAAHWMIGYLWRYLGNGAGMGLAFVMIVPLAPPWLERRRAGVLFGLLIWSGLITTLLLAPDGETKMFMLTPATLALSLIGHIVYGGVLGIIDQRYESHPAGRVDGRRPCRPRPPCCGRPSGSIIAWCADRGDPMGRVDDQDTDEDRNAS